MLEAKWIGPPSFRSGAFTMAPEHPPLLARCGPEYFSGQYRDSHASLQTLAAGFLPLDSPKYNKSMLQMVVCGYARLVEAQK